MLSIVAKTLFNVELAGEAHIVGESLEDRHELLHEPDALVRYQGKASSSLDAAVLEGHPADRRHHLRHHPPAALKR